MAQNSRRISDAFAPFRNPYSQSEQALMSPVAMAEQYAPSFGMWAPSVVPALMSPVPMAEEYATKLGMRAPSRALSGPVGSMPAKVTRQQGTFAGGTLPGAIAPSAAELQLDAGEKQTREAVDLAFSALRDREWDYNIQHRLPEPWRGGRTYMQRLHDIATRAEKRYRNQLPLI
jgi:hypothetical protein